MVSLCDTHWRNFNKFSKFVNMAGVQRVNSLWYVVDQNSGVKTEKGYTN
jgi:hypothetical protein